MNFMGIWESSAGGNPEIIKSLIPLSVIVLVISLLSFTTIFLFKKRKLQLKLAVAIILLTIVFIGMTLYYLLWVTGKFQTELVPGVKMLIPLLILTFGILAFIGIKKDEKLVKSYDRLR
jgi:ABC-type transport system involved in cytochrome c biogenesis permease subunit